MAAESGKSRRKTNYSAIGMSVGLLLGGILGVVYGIVLDNMTFLTIAAGGGMVIGLSIGAALEARKREKEL